MFQDVLTPFATLFMAVGLEATRLGYKGTDNVMPLITQALELCYSRSPNVVRQKHILSRHRYWVPQISDSEFCLNNRSKCQLIRRARGTIIEPFDDSITMTERRESAQNIYRNRPLPNNASMGSKNYFLKWVKNCQNCGRDDHMLPRCKEEFVPCVYPHTPRIKNPPHSTLMCPDLMSYCSYCKFRGHRDQEHARFGLDKSPYELRETFKKYCHLGLLSCLPFLPNIRNHHFRACLSATSMARGQPDLWLYGGPNASIPDAILHLPSSVNGRERAIANRYSNPFTYIRDPKTRD